MIVRPSWRDVLRHGAVASLLPVPAVAKARPSKPIRIVRG
jgi:hypothetical protein